MRDLVAAGPLAHGPSAEAAARAARGEGRGGAGGAAAKGQVDDALGVAAEQRASCRPPSQDADLAALDRIRQEAFAGGELGRRGLGGGLLLALVQRHRRALGRAEGVASRGGVRVHGFYSRSASYRR